MTTTTAPDVIEGIDLDAVSVCENPDGCSNAATHRLVWTCLCGAKLACWQCVVAYLEYMCRFIHPWARCVDCGVVSHPQTLADLVRVEAL